MNLAAWVICTEEDLKGTIWTGPSQGPTKVVAERVKALARATWECLDRSLDLGFLEAKSLFDHPLDHYDFLIHLDPSALPRYPENTRAEPEVWERRRHTEVLPTGDQEERDFRPNFDPVSEFVRDLEHIYGDAIEFFYNAFGGTMVGGVWNPHLKSERPFKVHLGISSTPKDLKSKTVGVNRAAILAEIERMGKGIVKAVKSNSL